MFLHIFILENKFFCLWNYNVFHFDLYVGHARKIRVSSEIYKFGGFDLYHCGFAKVFNWTQCVLSSGYNSILKCTELKGHRGFV